MLALPCDVEPSLLKCPHCVEMVDARQFRHD
jgi:hypothetical protein